MPTPADKNGPPRSATKGSSPRSTLEVRPPRSATKGSSPRSTLEVRPPRSAEEIRALNDVEYESFAGFAQPREQTAAWTAHIGHDNMRVAVRDGRVVAGLGILHFGLYFGGRAIPATGISAVAVAPDARGSGVATELMNALLREQARAGTPLSVLFPASYALYRGAGYEVAGSRVMFRLALRTIGVRARALRVRPATAADHPAINAIHTARALRTSGHVQRGPREWRTILEYGLDPIFAYVVERAGSGAVAPDGKHSAGRSAVASRTSSTQRAAVRRAAAGGSIRDAGRAAPDAHATVEGYIIYTQTATRGAGFELHVRDMAASTPEAGRRLLSFLASNMTMAEHASVLTGPAESLLASASEEWHDSMSRILWMMRIADAPRALEQRGYPPGMQAALRFELRDELLRRNRGTFELRVADGRGRVRALAGGGRSARAHAGGGTGPMIRGRSALPLRMHIRGLSPLFSGLLSAGEVAQMGLIEGDEAALATATAIFSGPAPWMNDRF
ncbi:MAG: GNAT family N-acetyltransferase [Planctomycetia bacterium]|nr:MAG: GNAT family N-acetyltransferase [Planctomycetia bacterium]